MVFTQNTELQKALLPVLPASDADSHRLENCFANQRVRTRKNSGVLLLWRRDGDAISACASQKAGTWAGKSLAQIELEVRDRVLKLIHEQGEPLPDVKALVRSFAEQRIPIQSLTQCWTKYASSSIFRWCIRPWTNHWENRTPAPTLAVPRDYAHRRVDVSPLRIHWRALFQRKPPR
jgi:hypothetical protein